MSSGIALDDEIARGRDDAAVPRANVLTAPDFPLRHRIPCEQVALLLARCARDIHAEVPANLRRLEVLDRSEALADLLRGNVDQPGLRVVRHRMPAMRAVGSGHHHDRFSGGAVANVLMLDRPAGLRVEAVCPVLRDILFGLDELAGLAIE